MMVVRPEAAVLFRERIGNFLGLVLFANFLYSAAYGFELVALLLPSRRVNPTVRYFMLIAGTLLAAILTVAAVELGLLDNNGDQ